MTHETMTIHAALSELKVLDDRITKAITSGKYVDAVKRSAEKINGMTVEEYKNKMRADHNRVVDLIARRNAIKKAVVLSNAKTMVTVGGVSYTIAEAIELKNHGMENKVKLLNVMTVQNDMAHTSLERNSGEMIERRAEEYVMRLSVLQRRLME